MFQKTTRYFIFTLLIGFVTSCNTDTSDDDIFVSNKTAILSDSVINEADHESAIENIDISTLRGGNGCTNVVILNGYAYAACDTEIQIANLETDERSVVSIAADDISVDISNGLLFTQSGTTIRMLTISDPTTPEIVATQTANFSIFSGLSAANCVLAVSGGAGGSDTRIFNYSISELTLEVATDGIPIVDNRTGAPDVSVRPVSGGAQGFYSQDLGSVANWGIQIVNFNGAGAVLSTPDVIVLTPGPFGGPFGAPFGPANFPVESEFLNGNLYVAHFAVQGIEVIDIENTNLLSPIPLPYEPIHITTDGSSLFVVGLTNDEVDEIDPSSGSVVNSFGSSLINPTGVAASSTHIAVADQTLGLIVIPR